MIMTENNVNIELEPLRWYPLSYFTKTFKINYYFLKQAVEENRLHVVKFGNTLKTTGAEYIRFTKELLYSGENRPKKSKKRKNTLYDDLDDFIVFDYKAISKAKQNKKGIV